MALFATRAKRIAICQDCDLLGVMARGCHVNGVPALRMSYELVLWLS